MKMLSLFSGCGGMDIGFEGDFVCLKKSINSDIHPDWIKETLGDWVHVAPTIFDTVFANDIRPDAKTAWVSYFSNRMKNAKEIYHIDIKMDTGEVNIYHLDSIVDLVKRARAGEKVFPDDIDIVTGGFPCQDFSVAGKRLGFNSQKSHLGGKIEADKAKHKAEHKNNKNNLESIHRTIKIPYICNKIATIRIHIDLFTDGEPTLQSR